MGVYHLGNDSEGLGLSLKLKKPKISLKGAGKVLKKVAKPVGKVLKPVAKVTGSVLVPAPLRAVAKVAAKPASKVVKGVAKATGLKKKPVSPAGSPSVQVQRQLSAQTNKPGRGPRRGLLRRRQKPATGAPVPAQVESTQSVMTVLQKEADTTRRKIGYAKTATDKVAAARESQRKFSDTSRRAASKALSLKRKADAMAAAGIPGAALVAQQAEQAASVATQAAAMADTAGTAATAATQAGIAAAATGDEGSGVALSGLVTMVKQHPVAAAVGAGVIGFVLYRAVKAA